MVKMRATYGGEGMLVVLECGWRVLERQQVLNRRATSGGGGGGVAD